MDQCFARDARSNIISKSLGALHWQGNGWLTYMSHKRFFEYVEGTTESDLDFVKQLIVANCIDESVRPWILDYICDIVQNPASKPQTGVVFKGHAQGSGKGTLVELMQCILGKKLVHTTNHLDDYFGNFNSGLNGKVLCVCEEVSASDGVKYKEAMKTCLTDVFNTINITRRMCLFNNIFIETSWIFPN